MTTLVNFSSPSGSDRTREWRTAAKRALLFLVALWASVVATGRFGLAQTPTLYIIGGQGVTLTGTEVKEVYLGDKVFSGSVKLVPMDNAAARETFLSRVMGMTPSKYESTWTKKAFRDALRYELGPQARVSRHHFARFALPPALHPRPTQHPEVRVSERFSFLAPVGLRGSSSWVR